MVYRPSPKKLAGSADQSEYSFHLVGKKSAFGTSSAVVGAIATGPVHLLFSDVLGTAFDVPTAQPSANEQPTKLEEAPTQKSHSKSKGPRRRRISRTATNP